MVHLFSFSDLKNKYFINFDIHFSTQQNFELFSFEVSGTDLTQRFRDQFSPMLIDQNELWSLSDSTIIRMPLSSDCLNVGPELGSDRIKHITDLFMENGSRALLFLKSVLQVILQLFCFRLMQDGRKAQDLTDQNQGFFGIKGRGKGCSYEICLGKVGFEVSLTH